MSDVLPLLTAAAPAAADALRWSAAVDLQAAPAEGKRPTFSLVAYTGVPMHAGGFFHPVIVELSGVKTAREKIPILLDHDPSRIVGQGTVKVDSAAVRIEGIVTGEDADAQNVVTHARNGFLWQASIGAQVTRREFLEAGKTAIVNGREVSGPLMIARESILQETSFVAIGADQQTSAAVAAKPHKGTTMNFEAWLQAKGFDPAKIDDQQRQALKAWYDAEQPPAAPPAAPPANPPANPPAGAPAGGAAPLFASLDQVFQTNRREDARRAEIVRITAEALRDYPHNADSIEAAARKAMDEAGDPRDFELAMLRACRPAAMPGRLRRSGDERITSRVLECAIAQSCGLKNHETAYDERTLEAAHSRFRGGIGLQELLLFAARDAGCDSTSIRGGLENILRAAFRARSDLQASSGFSTVALPNILSNVANKFITEAFLAVESTWRNISAIRPVNDFKQITNHSLTGDLQYEKLGPNGEIKHGALGEEQYTNQADTYAKMLAITRRDIINDDLGAFAQVPRRLGRGAALKINDVFWTAFLDNSSFFTSGRGNYDDGTDTALTSAGLKAALILWHALTDPDGKPLGTVPRILLVSPAQEVAARELMNSTNINTGGAASTEKVPNANVFAGMFRVERSTYLSNSAYTGYSALAWYLLCDPMDIPVIETCFLGGREQPVVETADADFDQLGVRMRAYHDFGVTKQEYRGGCKFKGEA